MDTFESLLPGAAVNNATATKDTVDYEVSGSSLKLTGTGGTPYIYWIVIDGNDIRNFRNKDICVNVRLKNEAGVAPLNGRVALYDGTTTVTSTNGGESNGAWIDQSLIMKVGSSATYLRAYVYLDSSAPTESVIIDRVVTSYDRDLADGATETEANLKKLNVNGTVEVVNIGTDTRGVYVLSNTGAFGEDPEQFYVISVSASGISIKQRTDTHPRLRLGSNGLLQFGDGSAAPDKYLDSYGVGLLRVSGASVYPEQDNSHDIGIPGNEWKTGRFNKLSLNAGTVKVESGIGSPEGALPAGVGSIYTDINGGAGTTLYIKESGTGNTGWVAK